MNPATVQLILFCLELAVEEFPALKADVQQLMAKENPTPQDFADLRAKVAAEGYGQFVPDSAIADATAATATNNLEAAASVANAVPVENIATPGQ